MIEASTKATPLIQEVKKRGWPGGIIDLAGRRFGRLVVIKHVGARKHHALWLCKCDCGTELSVDQNALSHGKKKSCGCLYRESRHWPRVMTQFILPSGESARRRIRDSYISNGAKRGFEWSLSEQEFNGLIFGDCYYCGVPPTRIKKTSGNGHVLWNGIDRLDNKLGYSLGNVVSCCDKCNHAKGTMTPQEFIDWARRIWDHQINTTR